jgi:hypothetical protein
MYYGVGEEGGKSSAIDPCDINGAHFKPETYLDKTFKEKSLIELMDKEGDISKRKYFPGEGQPFKPQGGYTIQTTQIPRSIYRAVFSMSWILPYF